MRVLLLAVCLIAAAGMAPASEAGKLYKEGRKQEKAGHMAQAYLLYARAAALDSGNRLYWLKSRALQTRAALEAKTMPRPAADSALADEPGVALDAPDPQDLAEAKKPMPPKALKVAPMVKDFDLQGDSRALFEKVARAFGLDCVFDTDYQPTKPFRFRMDGADYRDALHAMEAASASFIIPLSDKLFMVAKDTPQKRVELEPSVAVVVALPEPTSAQDLTGLITAVQQSLGIQKVGFDTQNHIVVLRDAISKVLPAREIIEDLLYPRAQVEIEVKFIELSHLDALSYGFTLPTSLPLAALGKAFGNVAQIPSGIGRLALFGGGKTLLGLGVANVALMANMNRSSGSNLLDASLRSLDGQPATLHVGDRYPVLTSGYYGPASFQGAGSYSPPPSFNFEDLGLTVKATPRVHGMDGITLELETEFRLLTGQSLNGIPVISSRQLKSVVRLKTGEWAVVAGLMEADEAHTIAGIAGLSTLPGLGPLFSQHTRNKSSKQVLLVLRPRLLTLPADQAVTHQLRIGSDTRPLTPL